MRFLYVSRSSSHLTLKLSRPRHRRWQPRVDEARTLPQGGTLARVGLSALLGTNFHKPMLRAWVMQRSA